MSTNEKFKSKSKSLLIIDTPNSCSECELKEWKNPDYGYKCICLIIDEEVQGYMTNSRHPQCPLQDATELLRTLKDLGGYNLDTGWQRRKVKHTHQYNKLYKALGGIDNE